MSLSFCLIFLDFSFSWFFIVEMVVTDEEIFGYILTFLGKVLQYIPDEDYLDDRNVIEVCT